MTDNYKIELFFTPATDSFVASAPAFSPCTAYGTSAFEVLNIIGDAVQARIDAYLDTYQEIPEGDKF